MAYRQSMNRLPARWSAEQWEDFRIGTGLFQFAGAADPDITTWQPGGAGETFRALGFKVNDYVYFAIQMPHGWLRGSDIYAHLHWTPRDRGAAESGKTVEWTLYYTWASIDGTFSSSSSVVISDTCDGTNHKHQMAQGASALSGSGKGLSSMIYCALKRTGGTWVGNLAATTPLVLEFDIHYRRNSLGSESELVKLVG